MNRPGVPHSEADVSADLDAISGLYTTIPNFRVPLKTSETSDPASSGQKPATPIEWIPALAGISVAALPTAALLGWMTGALELSSLGSNFPPIRPFIAAAVALVGIALLLRLPSVEKRFRAAAALGTVLAGVGGVIALALLSDQLFGWPGLIKTQPLSQEGTAGIRVGGPSIAASTAVGMASVSVLLLNVSVRRIRPSDVLALVVSLVALAVILGYTLGTGAIQARGTFREFSFAAALTLVILSVGVLFARRDSGLTTLYADDGPGGVLVRRLLPAGVLVLILSWAGRLIAERFGSYDAEIGLTIFATATFGTFGVALWLSAVALRRAYDEVMLREAHLKRSREHLELALESGDIAAWEMDLATQTVKRSPKYDQIMGHPQQLPVWTFADFVRQIHPDDRENYLKIFSERTNEEKNRTVELRIIRPSGEVRHIWSIGRRVRGSGTSEDRVAGVMMDVTEQRRAREELRLIFERITDAFVAVDANYDFVYVNSKAAAMLQRSTEDLIGKNMWAEFPEGLETGFRDAYARAMKDQEVVVHEEFFEPLGIWIEIRVFPSPDGLSIYFHDVTDRKKAEAKILELNETLEQRVAERTRELENVNRELESFSYSVSHDLRAPLRAIDGFSAAIAEDFSDSLDAEGLGYLERVRNASKQMGLLIDDLLKLSRVSRAEMKRNKIDISELAERVLQRLQEADPDRKVEVSVQPGLTANGDDVLVRSVLENLLGNAWKFTSKSEVPSIEFGRREHGGVPMFFVADNGAGFDMAYRDKLFGAFQRLHSPAEFEGTGIGLATVQRIVSRHGGQVDAEGSVGKGATFYFSLGSDNKG